MSGVTLTAAQQAALAEERKLWDATGVDPDLVLAEARTYVDQPNALALTPDGRAAIYMARRLLALDAHRAGQMQRALDAAEAIAARYQEAQAGLDKVQALVVPVLAAARAVETRPDSDNLAKLAQALRALREASAPRAAL